MPSCFFLGESLGCGVFFWMSKFHQPSFCALPAEALIWMIISSGNHFVTPSWDVSCPGNIHSGTPMPVKHISSTWWMLRCIEQQRQVHFSTQQNESQSFVKITLWQIWPGNGKCLTVDIFWTSRIICILYRLKWCSNILVKKMVLSGFANLFHGHESLLEGNVLLQIWHAAAARLGAEPSMHKLQR